MTDPVETLQRHVYQQLSSDPTLAELGYAVYDQVPEDAVTPYVVLGEFDQLPDDDHTDTGAVVTVTLHGWSRYRGYREVARCMHALRGTLHRTRPDLAGWDAVSILHQGNQYLRDTDPDLRHAVGRFTARFSGPQETAQ